MTQLVFPKGFLWGAATSAPQIEGAWDEDGRSESIWDRVWHRDGKANGDVACDHYHRWQEDLSIMKSLGLNTYRFSVAWPRVLPGGTGQPNQKGLDFYRRLIDGLLDAGIAPNLTLYHWDLPQALEDRGGWVNRDCTDWFCEYAGLLYKTFGDRVPMWATVNEPSITFLGYAMSDWAAPRRGDMKAGMQALHHLFLAHGKAVNLFRQMNMPGKIGIVLDFWRHFPARDCDEDRELARKSEEGHTLLTLNLVFKGRHSDFMLQQMDKMGLAPQVEDGDFATMSVPLDFLGVNNYSRAFDTADEEEKKKMAQERIDNPDKFNMLGWEVYPTALYDAVMLVQREYAPNLPMYITENGFSTPDEVALDGRVHDPRRTAYYRGYLAELHRAMGEGANVRGYNAWSLLDNFEWGRYDPRFGIVYVDFQTQQRILKDSALWYREVIRNNGFAVES